MAINEIDKAMDDLISYLLGKEINEVKVTG